MIPLKMDQNSAKPCRVWKPLGRRATPRFLPTVGWRVGVGNSVDGETICGALWKAETSLLGARNPSALCDHFFPSPTTVSMAGEKNALVFRDEGHLSSHPLARLLTLNWASHLNQTLVVQRIFQRKARFFGFGFCCCLQWLK